MPLLLSLVVGLVGLLLGLTWHIWAPGIDEMTVAEVLYIWSPIPVMAVAYALSSVAGYRLASRIRYWLLLVAPLVFGLGFFLILSSLFGMVWLLLASRA